MATIKSKTRLVRIKEEIAYTKTGEIVHQEEPLFHVVPTGKVEVGYKNYIIIDTDALSWLIQNGTSQVDIALLIALSANIEISTGVCLDKNQLPYSTKSFAEGVLKQSVQAVRMKLKRLEKEGLLYYGKVPRLRKKQKVYVLNPHLIRRGTKYESVITSLFNPIIPPAI